MRIVQIVSGAGGMYCGSCLHANGLARAVRAMGVDLLLVPAYTPLRTDDENQSGEKMVFGGLNVYLQEKCSLFRHTPRWLDRWLDSPRLLNILGKFAGATRPERLGRMTVSMLRGEEGRLRKEVDKLVDWLADEVQPDLVHLSNVMLVGMAREIRRRLEVPVVCSLTGEDAFLDRLPEPHYKEAREILRERCADLSALIALNDHFAKQMTEYLDVPAARVHVIRPGLDLADFEAFEQAAPPDDSPMRTIGFLSRISPEKGLHDLADAWIEFSGNSTLPPTRLQVAGYLGPGERRYLLEIEKQIAQHGLADRFEYVGEPDRAGKIAFLHGVDLVCLPSVLPESKGLPVLEAWAARRPVVLPDHGVFREMVKDTGGGLLYPPGDGSSLIDALDSLMRDDDLARALGESGHRAVSDRYQARQMAEKTVDLYRSLLS